MTICIVTNIFYPAVGGIPNYYKYLAENLISQGHSVIVLTVNRTSNQDDIVVKESKFTKIELSGSYNKYKSFYQQYFRTGGYEVYDWLAIGACAKDWLLQNHYKYQIDILETLDYGGLGAFLTDDRLPPVIIDAHSSITQLKRVNFIPEDDHAHVMLNLEEISFRYADGILAHSPFNKNDLEKIINRNILFARSPWIYPTNTKNKVAIPKKNIVVASLQLAKGAELLIRTLEQIKYYDTEFSIHWIGGDTYTADKGVKVSDYLSKTYPDLWNKQFNWKNQVDHNTSIQEIATANLVLIPSIWDTFNYCAVESAWLQKPLIITENTGATYLFENDSNVKIVPSTQDGLANILLNKSALNDWIHSINAHTKSMLEEYFSPEKIIRDRIGHYNMVLDERKTKNLSGADNLSFLNAYYTSRRKFYYSLRNFARKIVKGK